MNTLEGKKYLSLETYRKNGKAVRTPVWFAADTKRIYVYSTADSGKAKRIRATSAARIAPCDIRGNVTGPWIDANARVVHGEEFNIGMRLLDRKYWPWKQLLNLFARHDRVVLAIEESAASTPLISAGAI